MRPFRTLSLAAKSGAVVAAGALTAGTAAALFAAGSGPASMTPAPAITSAPSTPTRATSAAFTFTDTAPGAVFSCAFDASTFASCQSPTTYAALGDGTHTFRVRAQASNRSMSTATARTWTVDTVPPPPPTFTTAPNDPTTATSAQFALSDSDGGATFQCALDGGASNKCSSRPVYTGLSVGDHCLRAQAVDPAGNLSRAVSSCWTIVIRGGFDITGDVVALAPGVNRPLNLTIKNPFNFPIRVTDVSIGIQSSTNRPTCSPSANLLVDHGLLVPVNVPANSTRTLQQLGVDPASWPLVAMLDLATPQDSCKGAVFPVRYTATASKP